jgi:phosphoribosylglycinamide formyltransferase-1
MSHRPLRIGVLGSGKGTNLEAIVHAIAGGDLDAEIRIVVSDLPYSPILERARAHGLTAEALSISRYRTRLEPEIESDLALMLEKAEVELLVLAGYLRMVKSPLLERFRRRIVNIHPSLLPEFPGLEAWKQALDAGVPYTGCTVHWVDEGMDTGAIIAQSKVLIEAGDTPDSLHERIQIAERRLYPSVLQELAAQIRRTPANCDSL